MIAATNFPGQKISACPDSDLERQLIEAYLLSKDCTMDDLRKMPAEQRNAFMKEACLYAALRLADIEAKSKFRDHIKLE